MKLLFTSGSHASPAEKALAYLLVLLLAGLLSGCGSNNSQLSPGNKTPDAGKTDPTPDTFEEPDTFVEPDTYVEPPPPTAGSAHGRCAAAGETAGGGFQVVHCTAPAEPAVQPMAGGGFQVQPGALQVILP